MSKILNYERNETLATGFVRPKVTSLFFDKIWIPESLLDSSYEFYAIPKDVLIVEKEELKITNSRFEKPSGKHFREARYRNISDERVGAFYDYMVGRNHPYRLGEFYFHQAMANNAYDPLDDPEFIKFKYSKNRNHAILVSTESFNRKYKLHISPVFHDLTEFEKQTQSLDNKDIYGNDMLRFKIRKPNTFLNKDAFSICIQDFPSIKEDELSWEQVMDIRSDKKRIQKLKRFTSWANRTFTNESPDEIRELLETEIDEYKRVLREHGVKTTIGSFSTIVSSASSIATLLTSPNFVLLPLLSVTSLSISFAVNTYFSSLKNRNNPIAYLYDITENF
ncbi:MAG: hypothetical protein IJZ54_00330 [Clostridia bacterium]|nr:hypothetical protein [Clostridia bacterium]